MIDIIMNEGTRYKLESDKKLNKKVKDKVYDFAMRTLNEKGYANFIYDNNTEDNTVIIKINGEEIIYEFKG